MRLQLAHRLIQGVMLVLADASERVGDLGQVAVGSVLEGGDRRRRERGADGLCLTQRDGTGGGRAGADAGPAAER